MDKSCCFTGYRPEKFSFELKLGSPEMSALEKKIYDIVFALIEDGYNCFYCGMASGFDLLCGKAVANISHTYPEKGIRLVAAIPFAGQSNSFSPMWKKLYDMVLSAADESVLISESYHISCFERRNRYMVDNSSRVICYFDGQSGGTANTVKYALSKGRLITNLADYKIPESENTAYQLELI